MYCQYHMSCKVLVLTEENIMSNDGDWSNLKTSKHIHKHFQNVYEMALNREQGTDMKWKWHV